MNQNNPDQNTIENQDVVQELKPASWYRKRKFAKTDTVYQMEVSECGAASLSMVMGRYGVYVSPELLRVQTGVSRNGVNARNICDAASKNGFIANGYRRDIDKLLKRTAMPCIVHWDFRHFVVLEGCRLGKMYINDPASGRRSMKREEFEKHYTGIVLEFIPTDNIIRGKKQRTLFNFAIERLHGQSKYLWILFALELCLILPGLLSPVFSRVFLDEVLIAGEKKLVKWILLGLILTALYEAYFTLVKSKFAERFKDKMTLQSSDSLLQHLFKLPLGFFEQRVAGDLVQRIQNNENVSRFLTGEVISLAVGLITSLIYMGIMLLYDVRLALVGVGFSLISLLIIVLTAKKTAEYTQLYGMDSGKLIGSIYSGMLVSSSIKAAGAENEYVSKILGYNAMVTESDQKLGKFQELVNVVPEAISSFNTLLVLILGSKLIIEGSFTPGMLIAFTGFLSSFSGPFSTIVNFSRGIQQLKNDMSRVDDLMQYEEDECYTPSKELVITEGKLKGEVELKDISFAYGGLDRPLVKGINLHIQPGQSVALVGSSGCGKSTIAKLITSLYKPWTGEILFDGVNADKISRNVLSDSLAVVTQNIVIFEGSVYENISAWNRNITREDAIRAAKDACIHDDIVMKAGTYDYHLTTNGSNISGGQRQRIEIAKALAGNPSILVLDEATSFLDTLTEKKIYDNIKSRNCTCVIVAQRISSIRDCDEIIVLKNGRIIERGKHMELMNQKGAYYELVSKAVN